MPQLRNVLAMSAYAYQDGRFVSSGQIRHRLVAARRYGARDGHRPFAIFETLKALTGRHPRIVRNLSVPDGINAARVTLGSCWFDAERCRAGLEALRAYHADFDERTKAFDVRPKHDWSSHGADAFRYLAVSWREMQPAAPSTVPPQDSWDRAFERAASGGDYVSDWRTA